MKKKILFLGVMLMLFSVAFAQEMGVNCIKVRETEVPLGNGQTLLIKDWECDNGCNSSTFSVDGVYAGASVEICDAI
jgi:hypothetical protein